MDEINKIFYHKIEKNDLEFFNFFNVNNLIYIQTLNDDEKKMQYFNKGENIDIKKCILFYFNFKINKIIDNKLFYYVAGIYFYLKNNSELSIMFLTKSKINNELTKFICYESIMDLSSKYKMNYHNPREIYNIMKKNLKKTLSSLS